MKFGTDKIQYIIKEQEVLQTLIYVMVEPASEDTQQHERNHDTFQVYKKKK